MSCGWRAHRFVVYKMDDKVGGLDTTFDDPAMVADDCRCAVYDLDFVSEESAGDTPRSKILIHWSPEAADARREMLYASSTKVLKKELEGVQIEPPMPASSHLTSSRTTPRKIK